MSGGTVSGHIEVKWKGVQSFVIDALFVKQLLRDDASLNFITVG